MAGGGSLGGGHKPKRGKSSKRKAKKRVGFVLDMTPLVDITFLLLTFFMFTTTMATPQVMEMSVPPEIDKQVDVKESELMTIFVDKEQKIYWFVAKEEIKEASLKEVSAIALRENLKPLVKNKLITVLKISEEAPYKAAINILDQLNQAELGIKEQLDKEKDPATGQPVKRKRKFTLATLGEPDMQKIEGMKKWVQ